MASDGSVLVDVETMARWARQQGFSVSVQDLRTLFSKMGFTSHVVNVHGQLQRLWRIPALVEARKIFEVVYGVRVPWPDAKGWKEK